jgi:hypothetical protein
VIARIEAALCAWSPEGRRCFAVHLLVWSAVACAVNVVLYVAGIIDENHLILVTLILSWLAITFTAADLVQTTDVRAEED